MAIMELSASIEKAGGIYKKYAARLAKLNIFVFSDFLYHIPFRYEDFSKIIRLSHTHPEEYVTIQGEITEMKNNYSRGYKTIQKAIVRDPSGNIEVTWFNQPFLVQSLHVGDSISLAGKIELFMGKIVMRSPDFEIIKEGTPMIHTGRLVPIYPETQGISSKWLRRQIYTTLSKNLISDYLPREIKEKEQFSDLSQALMDIHFPKSFEDITSARKRLAFDELFLLQLSARARKETWEKQLKGLAMRTKIYEGKINLLIASLPFTLTSAQKKAIDEILLDLSSERPMNRLLEGDVGSGKTIVAAIAMFVAHLNGLQSVLMAPTEILAKQHFKTISDLLTPHGVKIGFSTGSKKSLTHRSEFSILIGTHAVLSKNISFEQLGLVVIDEQQRFGVEQRSIIRSKGKNPHVLTMTATPIPRTVALTLYGDLDVSLLDQMPKGRKEVKTWLIPDQKRKGAYSWIKGQIEQYGIQAFIVCPFIEESESMKSVKAASKEYLFLQKEVFPDLKLGLLHGRQNTREKDKVLDAFRKKEIDILVATPVVEVGIDIPNATIIIIEAAERFGLAGLHQLRGRVGRGDRQSYCLLFTDSESPKTRQRLKALETIHLGNQLAELDLELRGGGDLYGTMQHGQQRLKVATFSDVPLIETSKKAAETIYPRLSSYPQLFEKVKEITIQKISPD